MASDKPQVPPVTGLNLTVEVDRASGNQRQPPPRDDQHQEQQQYMPKEEKEMQVPTVHKHRENDHMVYEATIPLGRQQQQVQPPSRAPPDAASGWQTGYPDQQRPDSDFPRQASGGFESLPTRHRAPSDPKEEFDTRSAQQQHQERRSEYLQPRQQDLPSRSNEGFPPSSYQQERRVSGGFGEYQQQRRASGGFSQSSYQQERRASAGFVEDRRGSGGFAASRREEVHRAPAPHPGDREEADDMMDQMTSERDRDRTEKYEWRSQAQRDQAMKERRESEEEEEQREQEKNEKSLERTSKIVFNTQRPSSKETESPSSTGGGYTQQIRTKRSSSLDSASSVMHRLGGSLKVTPEKVGVIIAGWPNELAIQCAKACVKRGYKMLPIGICFNDSEDDRVDITDVGTVILYRYGDSQLRPRLVEQLRLAEEKQDLFPIIIDTSLKDENLFLYRQLRVPFVFESRADDIEHHQRAVRETEKARCFALISQRMDKHVAAVDSLLEDMAGRFPGLFADSIVKAGGSGGGKFDFVIKTSEPDDKVNRRILSAMSDLLNKDIGMGKVSHVAGKDEQERHGLNTATTTKQQHVKRTYELKNANSSTVFTFEQSMNATYECAEGVADSVSFLAQKAQESARPRVYDILDVAQQSRFLTW